MGRPLPFESASKVAGLTRPVQPMILWELTDNQAGEERAVLGDRPPRQARTILRVELATVRGRNKSTVG